MNSWNEGYFTNSTYVYGYYRELSPNFMRWCLLLKGIVAPEITEDSCHCELGFGQGVSANIHAAATPGKYFGTDFNPAHAAQAKELAEAAGAGAKFFEDSFEEFSKRDDLPNFDSIGLHGIWTWVSAENRQHIMDIARQHLKSGGILYNSYNCLPGWAPNAPLRELLTMYDRYCGGSGAAKGRVGAALKFVGEMIDAQPAYANLAPKFKETFERLKNYPPDYVAHEYLNLDWDLMYFADVAEISQAAKLDFATTAAPIENVEDSFLSAKARDFLNKIENPIVREQARDYFVNRQFRKDIYVRGLRRLNSAESLEKLLATRYVLLQPKENIPQKFNHMGIDIALSPEILGSLLEYLQEENFRPKNLRGYLERNPSINANALIQIVIILANNRQISPCQSEEAVELVKNSCERLNAHIFKRSRTDDTIKFLASPLTGGGVMLNRFQKLFLEQTKRGNLSAENLAAEIWKIFSARGERLISEGKVIESPEENLTELKNSAENFLSKELPIFKALSL